MVRQAGSRKHRSLIGEWEGLIKALCLLFVILAFGYWWLGVDLGLRPAPRQTIQQVEQAYISAQNWQYIKYTFWALVLLCFAALCLWGVGYLVADMRRRWLRSQIVDGIHVDNYKYRTKEGELHKDTTLTVLDKLVDPITQISRNGSQQVSTISSADPVIQAHYSGMVARQRSQERLAGQAQQGPGAFGKGKGKSGLTAAQTRAHLEDRAGVNTEKARLVSLQADDLEMRIAERHRRQAESESKEAKAAQAKQESAAALEIIPYLSALEHPNRDAVWFGQNQETGRVAIWDLTSLAHLRLHGSTGAGKSYMLKHVCAQIAKKRHWLIFLDNSNLVDCELFRYTAQLVNCKESTILLNALEKIWLLVEMREQLLTSHIGAAGDRRYENLPETVKSTHERLFVVLDEWADHVAKAESSGLDGDIVQMVDRLTAKARKCGVHVILADQKPENGAWTTRIKQNVQGVLSGPLNSNMAASVYGGPMPRITQKHVMAYNQGDQLVKGFFAPELLESMYNQTKAKYAPPVHIDIGGAVETVERKSTVKRAVTNDPAYDALTDGVKDVVDYLVNVGFADVDAIPTKATAEGLGVGKKTVQRAKAYLRENGLDRGLETD